MLIQYLFDQFDILQIFIHFIFANFTVVWFYYIKDDKMHSRSIIYILYNKSE